MWGRASRWSSRAELAAIADATFLERWFTPAFRACPTRAGGARAARPAAHRPGRLHIACGRAVAAVDWLDRLAESRRPRAGDRRHAGCRRAAGGDVGGHRRAASPVPSCRGGRAHRRGRRRKPQAVRPGGARGSSPAGLRRLNAWAERGGLTPLWAARQARAPRSPGILARRWFDSVHLKWPRMQIARVTDLGRRPLKFCAADPRQASPPWR